jgi:hypothetical protein
MLCIIDAGATVGPTIVQGGCLSLSFSITEAGPSAVSSPQVSLVDSGSTISPCTSVPVSPLATVARGYTMRRSRPRNHWSKSIPPGTPSNPSVEYHRCTSNPTHTKETRCCIARMSMTCNLECAELQMVG